MARGTQFWLPETRMRVTELSLYIFYILLSSKRNKRPLNLRPSCSIEHFMILVNSDCRTIVKHFLYFRA